MISKYKNFVNKKMVREWIVALILIIIFLVFSYLLISDIRTISRTGFSRRQNLAGFLERQKRPLTVSDVDYVQAWMTFHYINTVFNIPENFLKDSLKISDGRYPNITLHKYVSSNALNEQTFIATLKQDIRDSGVTSSNR